MAQPPLSRQIQALEGELGFVLFERNRRQVELTRRERRCSSTHAGESGRIVVAYPSTFAYSGLPELVRAFRAKFRAVELVLRERRISSMRSVIIASTRVGLCRKAGFTPRVVQEAPQLDIVSLVAAGLGVSLLPSSIRNFRRSGIVLRPIIGGPRTELLVVWSAQHRSAVLREFLDVVRRQRKR